MDPSTSSVASVASRKDVDGNAATGSNSHGLAVGSPTSVLSKADSESESESEDSSEFAVSSIELPSGLEELLSRLEAEEAIWKRRPLMGGPDDGDAIERLVGIGIESQELADADSVDENDDNDGELTADDEDSDQVENDEVDYTANRSSNYVSMLRRPTQGLDISIGMPLSGSVFTHGRLAPLAASGRDGAARGPDA